MRFTIWWPCDFFFQCGIRKDRMMDVPLFSNTLDIDNCRAIETKFWLGLWFHLILNVRPLRTVEAGRQPYRGRSVVYLTTNKERMLQHWDRMYG